MSESTNDPPIDRHHGADEDEEALSDRDIMALLGLMPWIRRAHGQRGRIDGAGR